MLFDQPADHLEPNESLQGAAVLKGSTYEFKLQYLINIFRWHTFVHGTTYLHFTFAGRASPIAWNRGTQT
ncbi:hypothetical protein [Candidatus Nitrotoga arctica]|uniref:Uncharacterized protein n=1 Tax=Candidatus Nitrotoga arctica TaxID=453162 RepID=A0ABM8Z2Q1_9PROT|nr:hypothetical protein [Candidatus Nitrotoga arctica]CAG9934177.1 protein of unknown function [Candidatus Nitrotoga arctica]